MKKVGIFLSILTAILIFISFSSLYSASRVSSIVDTVDTKSSIIRDPIDELDAIKSRLEAESTVDSRLAEESFKSMLTLIIKFVFSLLFGCSALYVVLSKKYDQDTQKWAFSVLSLISGVWIGTVS